MSDALTEIHRPVLLEEAARHLAIRPEGVYLDGTIGAGGHAEAILKRLGDKGRLIGIDRDGDILKVAAERLKDFGDRLLLHRGSFEDPEEACRLLGIRGVDGIILDLGVSSLQLDDARRGFSFAKEAELDMRMDTTEQTTAREIVRKSSERELEKILREFGEEPFARRIARAIVEARRRRPIETTAQLAGLVAKTVSGKGSRLHPATRTFQALRIAVNRELDRLELFLERAPAVLAPGGRLVLLSYHSLEDRLVKRSFLKWEREGVLRRLTKKPIRPGETEIRDNPRARSAKMRVAEKMS